MELQTIRHSEIENLDEFSTNAKVVEVYDSAATASVEEVEVGFELRSPNEEILAYPNFDEVVEGIITGSVKKSYKIRPTCDSDEEFDWITVEDLCETEFSLKTLYKPIWAHSMKGLFVGAFNGILLKALDTTITFFSVDSRLGWLWLFLVAAILSKRWWMPAVILLIAAKSEVNIAGIVGSLFLTILGVFFVGAIFGGPAGLLIGTVAGYIREKNLPRAADFTPEGKKPLFLGFVAPALFLAFLIPFYLYWVNPMIISLLTD